MIVFGLLYRTRREVQRGKQITDRTAVVCCTMVEKESCACVRELRVIGQEMILMYIYVMTATGKYRMWTKSTL
jgi:hypothetical protein